MDITNTPITAYLASLRKPRDPLLARLEAEAAAEGWPIVDREAANLLEVLTLAAKPVAADLSGNQEIGRARVEYRRRK